MVESGDDEFKILSIEGGGFKGLFSACVLDEIERANGRLTDYFDMLCGTSTGGLIALGLGAGRTAADMVRLYEEQGPSIFPDERWLGRWRRGMSFLVGRGKFSDEQLHRVVGNTLGAARVRDANSYLCIPTVNLTTASPWLFKTDHDASLTRDADMRLRDIAMATSAAPFYFPVAVNQDIPGGQYVDGGLWANNPAFVGLVEACRFFVGPGKPFRSVRILSVPTLAAPLGRGVSGRRGLSVARAGREIALVTMEIQSKCVDNYITLLAETLPFPVTYTRTPSPALTPEQSRHVVLDCASHEAIETLVHFGRTTGHSWNKRPETTAFFRQPAPAPRFRIG